MSPLTVDECKALIHELVWAIEKNGLSAKDVNLSQESLAILNKIYGPPEWLVWAVEQIKKAQENP